jgi:hypothetical protein
MTADGKAIHYAATIRYGAGLSKTLASNLEPDAIVIAKDAGQPNTPLPLRVTYYTQACSVWGLGSCDAPVEIGSDDFTYVLWAAEEAVRHRGLRPHDRRHPATTTRAITSGCCSTAGRSSTRASRRRRSRRSPVRASWSTASTSSRARSRRATSS